METEVTVDATDTAELDTASQPFEGRWAQLVSTTNWEKGQIIHEWRLALKASEAPATEYSDEAWARRVGGVTGQHVGRLRRVYERFGGSFTQYEGLYWSHFQAALDWDDAEMWLEGTIQNSWSVSQMRQARWQALGASDDGKPQDEDIVTSELNEDLDVREDHPPVVETIASVEAPPNREGPEFEGPDFGDEDDEPGASSASGQSAPVDETSPSIPPEDEPAAPIRPFENIPELPDDVSESFESFKLCIIRHKANDWREISRENMLSALESLKELALAPSLASD